MTAAAVIVTAARAAADRAAKTRCPVFFTGRRGIEKQEVGPTALALEVGKLETTEPRGLAPGLFSCWPPDSKPRCDSTWGDVGIAPITPTAEHIVRMKPLSAKTSAIPITAACSADTLSAMARLLEGASGANVIRWSSQGSADSPCSLLEDLTCPRSQRTRSLCARSGGCRLMLWSRLRCLLRRSQ
jgi:hypothetical protein